MKKLYPIILLIFFYSCRSNNEEKNETLKATTLIAFISDNNLCVADENGESFKIIKEGIEPSVFSWGEDYNTLLYKDNHSLFTIDTKGNILNTTTPKVYKLYSPISYRSDHIIAEGYIDSISDNMQIFILNQNGELLRSITDGSKRTLNPSISKDQSKIAYIQQDGLTTNSFDIYIQNIEAPYKKVNLTNDSLLNKFPSWSPNGKHIAYLQSKDGEDRIWIMDSDGKNKRLITNELGAEIASWSPDSKNILVQSFSNKGQFLKINVADTSKKRYVNIKEALSGAFFPIWAYK